MTESLFLESVDNAVIGWILKWKWKPEWLYGDTLCQTKGKIIIHTSVSEFLYCELFTVFSISNSCFLTLFSFTNPTYSFSPCKRQVTSLLWIPSTTLLACCSMMERSKTSCLSSSFSLCHSLSHVVHSIFSILISFSSTV